MVSLLSRKYLSNDYNSNQSPKTKKLSKIFIKMDKKEKSTLIEKYTFQNNYIYDYTEFKEKILIGPSCNSLHMTIDIMQHSIKKGLNHFLCMNVAYYKNEDNCVYNFFKNTFFIFSFRWMYFSKFMYFFN